MFWKCLVRLWQLLIDGDRISGNDFMWDKRPSPCVPTSNSGEPCRGCWTMTLPIPVGISLNSVQGTEAPPTQLRSNATLTKKQQA